jgi:hypothetical protein
MIRPMNKTACLCLVAATTIFGCNKQKSTLDQDQGEGGVAAPGAAAALLSGFEGEIGLVFKPGAKERNSKPVPPLTLLVKDSKMRVDVPAGMETTQALGSKAYAVLNAPEKKLYAVLDDRKQVLLLDLNKVGEQLKGLAPATKKERAPGGAAAHPPPKITKTGQMDKIAGYACENWEIADPEKGGKVSVCVADQGASWFQLPAASLPGEYAAMLELVDGKHFPLRLIAYEKDGSEEARVEVTKIEKKPLAAQMFEIPATYQVVSLEQMMGQMMSGAMRMGGAPGGKPGFALPPGVTLPPGMPRPPTPPPAAPKAKHN